MIFEGWADTLQELSVGQAGLRLKRQVPTAEELTEAGLPEKAAQEVQEWMDALMGALPGVIDQRVRKILKDNGEGAKRLDEMLSELAENRVRQQREREQGPGWDRCAWAWPPSHSATRLAGVSGPRDCALAHVVGIDGRATALLAASSGAVQHRLAWRPRGTVDSWRRRRSTRGWVGQRP